MTITFSLNGFRTKNAIIRRFLKNQLTREEGDIFLSGALLFLLLAAIEAIVLGPVIIFVLNKILPLL